MGISAYLIWRNRKKEDIKKPLTIFFAQLILNLLWPIIFFGFGNYFLALIDIVLLFVMIGVTIYYFRKISKISACLLLPYLLWVGFATILNYTIWLNYR
jgi:tryptophan-rich sensory protein